MTWLPVKVIGATSNLKSKGATIFWLIGSLSQISGMASEATVSSCDRPMVATVRIRRGALEKRRMITNSTTTPSSDRGTEAEEQGEDVGHGAEGDEAERAHRRGQAELALGEVEDAVGPVDERHAERDERAEHAEHEADDVDARFGDRVHAEDAGSSRSR